MNWANSQRFLLSLLLILSACATPTEPESRLLPLGWWTGETMLQVRESGATLYLTCGAGTFERPSLNGSGDFRADGHVKISIGPPPPVDTAGAPATFSGHLSGSMLTLTMSSPNLTHTFTLHFDGDMNRSTPPLFCP